MELKDAPELKAAETRDKVHLITDPCPFCGKQHRHGAGAGGAIANGIWQRARHRRLREG